MFEIRPEQLARLRSVVEDDFDRRLLEMVRRHWTDICLALGADGVKRRIADARELAARHGISDEHDVARIVNIAFALGPGFEERYAWAGAFLRYDGMTASRRVDRMCALTAEELGRARPQ